MKTVLEELFDGNINPMEAITMNNPEYRSLHHNISKAMEIWHEKLHLEEYRELEDLMDLRCEVSAMENKQFFLYGFKLGALFMGEVLESRGEFLSEDES